MASKEKMSGSPLRAFVELIPESSSAHLSTLLRQNLRHVVNECRELPSAPKATQRRIVQLSFASLHGRTCFSFGSARSNDYQLPSLPEVAPHHFILYIHTQDRAMYIRNTCVQGIHIASPDHVSSHIQTCEKPVNITSSLQICVGGEGGPSFIIVNLLPSDHHEHSVNVAVYLSSLKRRASLDVVLSNARKRQGSGVDTEAGSAKHRRIGGAELQNP